MAKELPYFKFEPGRWDSGNIQMCEHKDKGLFVDLCSLYWQRLGDLPLKLAIQKICAGNATALDSLISHDIIKIIDDHICIDFLNEQLSEFNDISKINSKNAFEGWKKRRLNAKSMRPHSDGNAIRGEEIREEKKREEEIRKEYSIDVAGKPATKSIDDRKNDFMKKCSTYLDKYSKEMLREFFDYWTEKNEGGSKMRFEMQKVFDINRRLTTWSKNEKQNGFTKKQDRERSIAESIAMRYGSDANNQGYEQGT